MTLIAGVKQILRIAILALVATVLPNLAHAQAPVGFTKLANVTVLTYTDATCPNQTTCYYVVVAADSLGTESQPGACGVNQLCVNTFEAVAQMPSSGTHTVGLSWTASPSTGVSYNVYSHIGPLPVANVK